MMLRLFVPGVSAGVSLSGTVLLSMGLSLAPPHLPVEHPRLGTSATTDSMPRDPALTVGTLSNGMRYYVRANKTPARRAYLYLVVNAGSVLEDEDQRGFAHFVEHMAFNGTTHFPRKELISTLQLAGMRFGADINAATGIDQTVYQLEVPTDDGKSLAKGITMLEDWAGGGITIDSNEVIAERGVVLGEWRSRMLDTSSQALQDHQAALLYGADSRYVTRSPIGLPTLIQNAEPGPIRRFYHDWYRPDLIAIVAVGDFDSKQVIHEITARFGKIAPNARPRARLSPTIPTNTEPIVDVYRGATSPSITVAWKKSMPIVTTSQAYRDQLVRQLLIDGVNHRLQQMALQPRRPFVGAAIGSVPLAARGNEATLLSVSGWPTDSLEGGLAAALDELERTALHGPASASLARQKAALLRRYESAAGEEGSTSSQVYVDAYVAHYILGGGPLVTPTQELTLVRALLPAITPQDVSRAATFWRSGRDRVTLVQFPKYAHERIPTASGIAAIFDSVARTPPSADSAGTVAVSPLLDKQPAPGRITSETRDPTSGITTWMLSNGARVLIKPTAFDADELLLRAVSPGGLSVLTDSLFYTSGRMVAQMMTQAAGAGAQERSSLDDQRSTTGLRQFEVDISPVEEGMRLAGSPKELETLFQRLYLQFAEPKLDTTALNVWKQAGSPGDFSFDDQVNELLSSGNPRLTPPAYGLMQLADTASAMAVFRDRFGNAGDFTFIIVGAVKLTQLRPLVERYIASLPSTGKREKPRDLDVRPLEHMVRRTTRVFEIPRASTELLFDGLLPTKPAATYLTERRELDALSWLLRLKFTDDLREQMGGTYGVNVAAHTYALPDEHYRFAIDFDAAPERMNGMVDTMFSILDTVRAQGADADELAKIAAMQRRARETALADNHYWLSMIELYDRLQIPLAEIAKSRRQPLTSLELQMAAQRYLPTNAYLHLTAMPLDSSSYTATDSTSHAPPDSAGLASHFVRATGPSLIRLPRDHH